jgi:hypothetical protein
MVLRLFTGAVATLLGMLLSAPIAQFVLGQPDLTGYLQLAFATLLALSVSSYPGTVLVALGRFGRLSIGSVLNAAITLAGILLLLGAGKLDLSGLIAWNVVLPVVSTLPAWFLLPAGWTNFRFWWPRGHPDFGFRPRPRANPKSQRPPSIHALRPDRLLQVEQMESVAPASSGGAVVDGETTRVNWIETWGFSCLCVNHATFCNTWAFSCLAVAGGCTSLAMGRCHARNAVTQDSVGA